MTYSSMPPRKARLKTKTPLKSGNPPKRKARLKAVKEVPPSLPGQKDRPNPPTPPKPQPRTPKKAVALIKERSGGYCEIGLKCFGFAPAVQSAHRRGKGSGGVGPKNTTSNTAANLLRGCVACHNHIDNEHPADAERLGLKLRHTKAHPSEMPVYHYRLGWVLLDDAGGWRPAPEVACTPGALLPVVSCGPWDSLTGGGAVREALDRFGHTACTGLSGVRDLLLVCGCGSVVCAVQEVAA